jgi:hypothetical protein
MAGPRRADNRDRKMDEKRRIMSFEEIGKIEVDQHNRLYFDGKPLVLRQRAILPGWVGGAVILIALSAVVIAAIEVARVAGWISG